jgi:hypothetical protein
MSIIIEETIGHLRQPFTITEDGSSQTKLSNYGRVGFHIEKLFGLSPNRSRLPDFKDCELKTTQLGKKVSIGTMPESEFRRIARESVHLFETSDPYKKMKNTLVVIYTKLCERPKPAYCMNGWGFLSLDKMSNSTKYILQSDYEYICEVISSKCDSRDDVTRYLQEYGAISGKYLSLAYKGQGSYGYNYPAWNFQASFMKKLIHA